MSQDPTRPTVQPPKPPHDFQSICDAFGDPRPYLDAEGSPRPVWEAVTLQAIALPTPLALPWAPGRKATQVRVNVALTSVFAEVFGDLVARDLWRYVTELGGTYCWRRMRGGEKLSTHCWGIAIDLNPSANRLGTKGAMPADVVRTFQEHGFFWGGFWDRPDPMHWQYCEGSY